MYKITEEELSIIEKAIGYSKSKYRDEIFKDIRSRKIGNAKCPKCGKKSCYVICSENKGGCGNYAESVSGHITHS